MYLTLCGACTDRAPGNQVRDVLRRDHVEVLGTGGQLELVDLEQDAPCQPQALVDAETVVEPGIVDQSLPSDCRARLLEIHSHHYDQLVAELPLERRESRCVIDRGIIIVDRAWPDDHQQAIVRAMEHAMDCRP